MVKTQLGFAGVKESCADFAKTVVKIMADAMKVDPSTIEAKPAADCSDETAVQDSFWHDSMEDSLAQSGEKK